ncbi:hypothetical protein AVEN_257776-1 [Araneus ventricosus]|uniref:DUF4817 domain-containing protein n=1 Tax=Araneus ventricosus TaxID=182803 RepID=A0A4Y2KE16_ARAVE|nr:hypothetical protein AVEN_257776-1 [Araneus ventricosus]
MYGEYRRKANSATWLCRERFPEGPFPTNETIRNVVKLLRKTGHVTSRSRTGRSHEVGRQVQPEAVLTFAVSHPQSSTRGMSEKCGLSRSLISKLLNEERAHLYRLRPEQVLLARMLRDVMMSASLA